EMKAADSLLNHLGAFIRKHQRRRKSTQMCFEDSLWRCHINLCLARAHLAILRRELRPPPEPCRLPQSFFSLAHCGMLVMWKSVPQHIRTPELTIPLAAADPGQGANRSKMKSKGKDTNEAGESVSSEDDLSSVKSDDDVELKPCRSPQNTSSVLESLEKASVYLRRAMVLAHRWGHWTTLQWACRILWDQSRAMVLMCERDPEHFSGQLTLDQLYTVITPLLVLASDLLMDMMEKLKLWNVYDGESLELEASLHFSGPEDDGAVIDLRWVKSLVLHTLELLYYQAKWETLVHLALLFNTHTRECYCRMVTPVLVHAQWRLLERIACFGGPAAPQAHFTHTEKVSGEKVTCRNYANRQLLFPRGKACKIAATNHNGDSKELADKRSSMCLVCVPLDVDETLHCFRESLERGRHNLLAIQHCRNLLQLLLADTQQSHFKVPFSKGTCDKVLRCKVQVSMAASTALDAHPPDLSNEDFRSLGSICSYTLPPSHLQMVFTSYNSAIRDLKSDKHNSFLIQAFHDLGNLHFYSGNLKSARSFWSKALDRALGSSGVLETLDGGRFAQDTLRHAGIWGCLQGALLSAKIAQHILTSNIKERTNCCLLSAKLFKCLLLASLPHPTMDLSYSTYSVQSELIPGIDLFSEPDRGNLGATAASLSFICHWLYTTGHFLSVLPALALYLYVARTVCRDPCLTVKCRILKVVEDVVNKKPSKDISSLYGARLTKQLLMARVHLLLALCSTIHDQPMPSPQGTESQEQELNTSSVPNTSVGCKSKGLKLRAGNLTLGEVKALVLKEAHCLLRPELYNPHKHSTDPEELELAAEIRLLMATVTMQQGKMDASADLSAATLRLLQGSPVFQNDPRPRPPPTPASSAVRRVRVKANQMNLNEVESVLSCQTGDLLESVEARERMGARFWLRCRLALIHSLIGHIPGTAICSGANSSAVVHHLLREALAETEAWGDPDTKALLLLHHVQFNTHCGRPREESTPMLQEIVNLLSGCSHLSHRSQLVLAEATVLLGELRRTGSQTLLLLAQRILQQQLCAFGESLILKNRGEVEMLGGLKNIYLPQLPLLAKATVQIGLSISHLASSSVEEPWRPLLSSQNLLHSAFRILKESAIRETRLETETLYCTGVVGRRLLTMQKSDSQKALEALFMCLSTTDHTHIQNLRLIHSCYMEMVLMYLLMYEAVQNQKCEVPIPDEPSKETYLLISWIFLRIALKISDVIFKHGNLHRFTGITEGPVPLSAIKVLPTFALNDLFHPCGRLESPEGDVLESFLDADSETVSRRSSQLTWAHLTRYYMHLIDLLQTYSQPSGLIVLDGMLCSSAHVTLALRLSQMHRFFESQQPSYREQCTLPDPPAAVVLEPERIQHTQPLSALHPTTIADIQELIIQWYRDSSEDNTILLLFAVNTAPVLGKNTVAEAMTAVRAAQRSVCFHRLKTVRELLRSGLAEGDGQRSPSTPLTLSFNQKEEPNREISLEKSILICSEIRTLLRPDISAFPLAETLQTLGNCFNPATGGTLQDPAVITWLRSLLE
ncbi:hypothetical protein DNTS_014519, partial [Danionella cerebrum]